MNFFNTIIYGYIPTRESIIISFLCLLVGIGYGFILRGDKNCSNVCKHYHFRDPDEDISNTEPGDIPCFRCKRLTSHKSDCFEIEE